MVEKRLSGLGLGEESVVSERRKGEGTAGEKDQSMLYMKIAE
jgi:hypothetical protein